MVKASDGAAQQWCKLIVDNLQLGRLDVIVEQLNTPIGVVDGQGKQADVAQQLNNLPVHCKLAEDKLLQCKLAVPEVEVLGTDAVLSAAVGGVDGQLAGHQMEPLDIGTEQPAAEEEVEGHHGQLAGHQMEQVVVSTAAETQLAGLLAGHWMEQLGVGAVIPAADGECDDQHCLIAGYVILQPVANVVLLAAEEEHEGHLAG